MKGLEGQDRDRFYSDYSRKDICREVTRVIHDFENCRGFKSFWGFNGTEKPCLITLWSRPFPQIILHLEKYCVKNVQMPRVLPSVKHKDCVGGFS